MSSDCFTAWDILDETNQLIQISDLQYHMLYANHPARCFTGHPDRPFQGQKCYQYMMGLEEQCPFCPMRELGGRDSYTTQVDNGSQVFSVKTKRIQWEGQDAFIEYATDITAVSRAQQIFETQLHALLSSIPEAQGVFHLNLTQDQVLTMTGTSSNVEPLKTLLQVDALVESVASLSRTTPCGSSSCSGSGASRCSRPTGMAKASCSRSCSPTTTTKASAGPV